MQPLEEGSAALHTDGEFRGTARFSVRRRLGAGGFGIVFEAFDAERKSSVALKTLQRSGPGVIYHFKQEFRALADVVHPNLVQLYELHHEAGVWFFTMELVDGTSSLEFVRGGSSALSCAPTEGVPSPIDSPSLRSGPTLSGHSSSAQVSPAPSPPRSTHAIPLAARARLVSDPSVGTSERPGAPRERAAAPFDEARLRSLLAQLATGLSALHDASRLHRDVKPSNVLVTRDGRVVLVDFGLVVDLAEASDVSTIGAGTPVYMAPEQARGDPPSAAGDWYSAGVLLYEALTGEVPFDGPTWDVLRRKQTEDPIPPSARVEGVPPDLDQLCMEMLSRSPDDRPSGAEILARARSSGARETHRTQGKAEPRHAPFVGRERERSAFAQAFHSQRERGTAVVALVQGPSGIGKSALIRRCLEDLRRESPVVVTLTGRCFEQESVPYKAIDGLVDSLSRYLARIPPHEATAFLPRDIGILARLFPVLEQVDAVRSAPSRRLEIPDVRELRRRAFGALREMLSRIGDRWPLVLFIDDLQWGDGDSGPILVDLLMPPDPPPLLFIAAYRDDDQERSACLRIVLPALRRANDPSLRVARIRVGPLPEEEARKLARAILSRSGTASEDLADAIARESGGRPFFVSELSQFSRDREPRSVARPNETAHAPSLVSLDAIVRERVASLPDAAQRLLEVIAVAGHPIDRAAAARAAKVGEDELAAFTVLRSGRLIRARTGKASEEVEAYHDRIREAVAAGLDAGAKTACFRALAEALDGTGLADTETLAVYFAGAGEHVRAAECAVAAAEEASRSLAFDRAVRLHRMALELRPDDPTVPALREKLAEALVNAGRGAEAAVELLGATSGAPPARGLELRRRAAEQLLVSGHIDEGLAEIVTVLRDTRMRLPDKPWQSVRWLVIQGAILLIRGFGFRRRTPEEVPAEALLQLDTCTAVAEGLSFTDTVRGAYFVARAVVLALAAGEPRRVLRTLALLVGYGSGLGGTRPVRLLRDARAVAERLSIELDDPHGAALLRMTTGVDATMRGRWHEGRDRLAAACAELRDRCTGVTWEIDTAQQFHFIALVWSGAWQDIGERLTALLADARSRGDRYAETTYSLSVGYLPLLLDDDPSAAEALLRGARASWSRQRFGVQDYYFTLNLAEVQLYEGRGKGARATRQLESTWGDLQASLLLLLQLPAIETHFVRFRTLAAALASDELEPTERASTLALAKRTARRLGRFHMPWSEPLARLVEATLAALDGDKSRAIVLLEAAQKGFETVDCAHLAAAAKRRRGELTCGVDGRKLVEQADAWMAARGARDPARIVAMLAPGRWD